MKPFKEQKLEEYRSGLAENGFHWEEFNNGYHFKIGKINCWPTSDKWYDEETGTSGIFLNDLLNYIRAKKDTVKVNKLSVEQIFEIAKQGGSKSLYAICELIHKEIYG